VVLQPVRGADDDCCRALSARAMFCALPMATGMAADANRSDELNPAGKDRCKPFGLATSLMLVTVWAERRS
jgi:hypothetical protein